MYNLLIVNGTGITMNGEAVALADLPAMLTPRGPLGMFFVIDASKADCPTMQNLAALIERETNCEKNHCHVSRSAVDLRRFPQMGQ
ncbi:hypothetical protein [Sphingomonas sp. G-3-2-10]|uniref:hypothetical protein n=1 Tax=Sphingomonas sp. G-3-2-10 TaxID=2728838 RepID=UPI00146B1171|nr:hypothetical protein [Sphingomonas sp. G-3-2-10]NML05501.1 hypothetical protein [Sphingomonas sp. G-3-2-10]